jgi:hypothetical protein
LLLLFLFLARIITHIQDPSADLSPHARTAGATASLTRAANAVIDPSHVSFVFVDGGVGVGGGVGVVASRKGVREMARGGWWGGGGRSEFGFSTERGTRSIRAGSREVKMLVLMLLLTVRSLRCQG